MRSIEGVGGFHRDAPPLVPWCQSALVALTLLGSGLRQRAHHPSGLCIVYGVRAGSIIGDHRSTTGS